MKLSKDRMEMILLLQAGQGDFHVFLMVAGREPETNWWYTFGFESEKEFRVRQGRRVRS